jgi:serine phosphatase RsbU (regulator of sigma subunit)
LFAYGDSFHILRRGRPLSVAAELLWQLLPPQTFACTQLVISATMEPYDAVGGDGYDYAVDERQASVAVFDAVGHRIDAGLTCALALAATRNGRRHGLDLTATAALADEVIRGNVRGSRFVTALLAQLDLETGVLRYLNAGHPRPVLLRGGHAVKLLDAGCRTPLGLGHLAEPEVRPGEEHLEPGDRLLFYSDGITEARDDDGREFGIDRLVDLTERHAGAGLPAAETLRRLSHAVLEHQNGYFQDDATLLLLEWTADEPSLLLRRPEPLSGPLP